MSARERILGRIRGALGRTAPLGAAEVAALEAKLREHARGLLPKMEWDLVPHFRARCLALSSTVDDVATLAEVPAAVARYLSSNELPRTGVCWPQFGNLGWDGAGLAIEARQAGAQDLVGITGVFCALAETGTLMMLSGPSTHAKTSLLPETHVAIVPVSRIVRCMEDGWDLLRAEHGTLPRQVAFVSGPSRTADIEMTLVLGAHGPYRVHVVLCNDA